MEDRLKEILEENQKLHSDINDIEDEKIKLEIENDQLKLEIIEALKTVET